ncbi:myotubularin-related protein 13 [Drosophila guanche]|uniref:Blast:Myotubularin-related protein 13 n=1 Tax=Drosophila guanche TaxID=7266 RepID=A0A3B0K545_DROGU|nr:myotubularin-related protein 13 [Drosophila guanche]SPP88423.1 blast:Myotubularin-related protein 13 [Drosophila guanche]
MSRLADYFVIVGYDSDKEKTASNVCGQPICGKIVQRFPEKDWPDTPFIDGIEWFCQPLGWNLSYEKQEPKFFISVLTDIDANKHYCACLSFHETLAITQTRSVDDEDETIGGSSRLLGAVVPLESGIAEATSQNTHHSVMYAPKCLVLISRLDCAETFKNCLGTMYTVYIENLSYAMETLIGNILGCIQVPPAGGPQVRFSIGAGDKQSLQPPQSSSLPTTGSGVHFLFKQLGIKNVLILLCAVMTENKILFLSKCYWHLTESCKALVALMYPFRYTHVYIPILPAPLTEVLSTPTPFIMGIHSSLQTEITDLLDVIVVDLDGGLVTIPEALTPPVPILPSPLWEQTQNLLSMILFPNLAQADFAFPTQERPAALAKTDAQIDKELRAIFMRLFAQLLQGYRSCLTIIRIHPKTVITFHKAGFLGARDLIESEFLFRVLDSMFFTTFVNERGPPWRASDAWDELYSSMNELLKLEAQNRNLIIPHIQELGRTLFDNESSFAHSNYAQKVLRPPEGAFQRIHQPSFPRISVEKVELIIQEGIRKNGGAPRFHVTRNQHRIIPMGPRLPEALDVRPNVQNSARRLEVLRTCVSYIFENRIADARKLLPAVMRTLKHRDARLILCRELFGYVHGNKAILDHQQFELVLRFMNKALQNSSGVDEYTVAAALLPMSTIFCRKLSTGVVQFAYTEIQDHGIWKNLQFWESTFYQDVQGQIKALYLLQRRQNEHHKEANCVLDEVPLEEPTALEITAEQLRKSPTIEEEKKAELAKSEESTLYSQAIHFANRMVSLLIPLDVNVDAASKPKPAFRLEENQSVSNSILGSHSLSEHSDEGFEENDALEIGVTVGKTISRFIDCVCTEGGVTSEHIRNLHDMVPGVVHMHIESLEPVYLEAKRHPHVQKPKIQTPCLLPGEELVTDHLRCFLIPDGREDDTQCLIPAEGALFLTNYRVVFKGSPCDPLFCEQTIVRSFPISSLLKEKKISVLYLAHLDQTLPEGLQLRSSTFQLLKVAFDTEVTPEQIENFRKILSKSRHPFDEFEYFAFQSYGTMLQGVAPLKTKEKYSTLKGFAKKTLLRTAKKAGFKQKQQTKRKLVTDYELAGGTDAVETQSIDDELEDGDEFESQNNALPRLLTTKDMERMRERSYVLDWKRLGFDAESQRGFRISNANASYATCRSYPAIIVSPVQCSDAAIIHLGRYFKGQRIPLPTWRHDNGALLIRGAQPNSKSVIGMLKNTTGGNANIHHDVTHFPEQDKYFLALINTMPKLAPLNLTQYTGMNLSMSSLLGHGHGSADDRPSLTPELPRKHKNNLDVSNGSKSSGTMKGNSANTSANAFRKMRLYALGEKSQAKSNLNVEYCADFIPVDYPDIRQSRPAFKKLIRACMPSHNASDADGQSFAKMVEQSDWLQQISSLMQLSGAVVDLIDLQESSVMLSLEDGSDVTAQLSSIAQLCLDPYYRTLDGFRVLVEKEWLAFGHRFAHRSNLKPSHANTNIAFAPTFLQFLDVVHQLQRQFPMAFEFNDFYLRFLAYHVVSCRFRTFLFDCELERSDSGIAAMEDKRGSLNAKNIFGVSGIASNGSDDECNVYPLDLRSPRTPTQLNRIGHSIFDYIERQHNKTPIFYNFLYSPDKEMTLRPQNNVAALDLWSYYTNEELAQGPPYDLEVTTVDDEIDLSEMRGKRMVITAGYDNMEKCNPNAYVCLLSEVKHAETERGHLPQKWLQVWNNLVVPKIEPIPHNASLGSIFVQTHQHKRSTLEIIMKGRLAGYQDKYFHPHRFEKHPYTTPTNCNHCTKLLWGPVGYRCMDCGNSYHEKCTELSMKNCTKYKAIDGAVGAPNVNMSQGDTASIASSAATTARTSSHHFYNQFSSNVAENRTHEGHLYKRGALLKGWKQRWFVLDSIKHQLRYYDTSEDTAPKGIIELAEVQSVTAAQPTQIGAKGVDEKGFFDLKTSKRTYNFYAVNANLAQEWIEKLQACLQ